MTLILTSQPEDIPQITAIYTYHVLHGTGTFELEPPSENDMALRRTDVLSKGLPYLVAIRDEKVLGYAYCNWFKPRPAYRYSAEDSIYIAPEAQGLGLGRALLSELTVQAEKVGVRKLIAVIGDSTNIRSIDVHGSVGFSHVGVLKSCGWKFGQWLDVVMMDKSLGLGDSIAPDQ